MRSSSPKQGHFPHWESTGVKPFGSYQDFTMETSEDTVTASQQALVLWNGVRCHVFAKGQGQCQLDVLYN